MRLAPRRQRLQASKSLFALVADVTSSDGRRGRHRKARTGCRSTETKQELSDNNGIDEVGYPGLAAAGSQKDRSHVEV